MGEETKNKIKCCMCNQSGYLTFAFFDGEFVWICPHHYEKYIRGAL